MSIDAATLSPIYNPQVQAFVGDGAPVNGVTYQNLVHEHGADNVNNALFNLFNETYVNDVKSQYAGSPIEDDAIDFLNSQLSEAVQPTTSDAQADIDAMYRDVMKFYAENREEDVNNEAQTPVGEAQTSKNSAGLGSVAGGNWFVVLAQALGAAAGEHLKNAVMAGYKISDISGRAAQDTSTAEGREANAQNAQEMAMEQANLQASSQMFKMSFEATSTLIKTTGESFSSMARKQ